MTVKLVIPSVGESVHEVQIGRWLKHEGDQVSQDEDVVELETDKASMELPAPASGVLAKIIKHEGDSVSVGETIAQIDEDGKAASEDKKAASKASEKPNGKKPAEKTPEKEEFAEEEPAEEPAEEKKKEATKAPAAAKHSKQEAAPQKKEDKAVPATPSARRALRKYGLQAEDVAASGSTLRPEDVMRHVEEHKLKPAGDGKEKDDGRQKEDGRQKVTKAKETAPKKEPTANKPAPKKESAPQEQEPERSAGAEDQERPEDAGAEEAGKEDAAREEAAEEVVPMSLIRRRIAQRLVEAQQNAALTTTFNEVDMAAVLELRGRYRDAFQEKYSIKLGFMSFFVKAAIDALKQFPQVNAEVRGETIVFRNYYHIGIAVATDRGLVVPVLRHAERISFAEIEKAIDDFARRAREKKLKPDELEGGTFTISNGGVYGSLLSTPIVNPPQSGVLGMHAIQERPVARAGQVVARPMMYLALTYDHRIVDGREGVLFLKRIKEAIEDPSRMLMEV